MFNRIGLGYRRWLNNDSILGIYTYIDRTLDHDRFSVLNPGIEYLDSIDIRINGYIPIGHRTVLYEQGWAHLFGIWDYVQYQKHSMYDQYLFKYHDLGLGFDTEIGYHVTKDVATYIGGYHYSFVYNKGINGIYTNIEYNVFKNTILEARYSYDMVNRSTVLVGIRLDLLSDEDRMMESSRRMNGIIDTCSFSRKEYAYGENPYYVSNNAKMSTASPTPPVPPNPIPVPTPTPSPIPIPNILGHGPYVSTYNIWFLKHDGSYMYPSAGKITSDSDGTYEHPLGNNALTDDNMTYMNTWAGKPENQINGVSYANVWLGCDTDATKNIYTCTGTSGSNILNVPKYISISGMSVAMVDNKIQWTTILWTPGVNNDNQIPLVKGGLSFTDTGYNNNTYEHFVLNSTSSVTGAGVYIKTTGDSDSIGFYDVTIGNDGNRYATSIDIESATTVNLKGCDVYANGGNNANMNYSAVYNNGGTLNIQTGNTIDCTDSSGNITCAITNIGGILNIPETNSTISSTSTNNNSFAIYNGSGGTFTISSYATGNTITGTSSNNSATCMYAYGICNYGTLSISGQCPNATPNVISAVASGTSCISCGLMVGTPSDTTVISVTINGSYNTISATSDNDSAYGICNYNKGNVTLSGSNNTISTIVINANPGSQNNTGNYSCGIQNYGTFMISGSNNTISSTVGATADITNHVVTRDIDKDITNSNCNAYGIVNYGTFTMSDSSSTNTINAIGINSDGLGNAYGVYNLYNQASTGTFTMFGNHNTISVTDSGNSNYGIGLYNNAQSTISGSNNKIAVTDSNGGSTLCGIYSDTGITSASTTISGTNDEIDIANTTGNAFGIYLTYTHA